MQINVIFLLAIIIALVGSVIFLKGIVTAPTTRKRLFAFCKYAACVVVFFVCAWGYIFNNNLFWYGQNPGNAQIAIHINAEEVEESSFLYLLENVDATATAEDIVSVMGSDYEENTEGNYMIRYVAPNYTLDGAQPSFISFTFNKKRTQLLTVTWSYKDPSTDLFAQMLDYLETNAFGAAAASAERTADWVGLHLEDTGAYLLLQRVF